MNTLKPLCCGRCGCHPDKVINPGFVKAGALECACGRRTAWHVGEAEAVAEWNQLFGMVDDEPPITRLEV